MEEKLKKDRIGLAMEKVVDMAIENDNRNKNGNRKECSVLSEIEAWPTVSVWPRPGAPLSEI